MFLKKKCLNIFKKSGVLALKNAPKTVVNATNVTSEETTIIEEVEQPVKKSGKKSKITEE